MPSNNNGNKNNTTSKPGASKPAASESSLNKVTASKDYNTIRLNKPMVAKKPKVEFLDDTEEPFMLTNDDGGQEEFVGIAVIEYEDALYILMKPTDKSLEIAEDEAILFQMVPEDDEMDSYIPVEDDVLADKVFAEYLKAADEFENLED